MDGEEKEERWRQFCVQYAKSVAFKFADSWRELVCTDKETISVADIADQFSATFRSELTERLAAEPPQPRPRLATNSSGCTTTSVTAAPTNGIQVNGFASWRAAGERTRPASVADVQMLLRSRTDTSPTPRRSSQVDSSPLLHTTSLRGPTSSSSKRLSWFRSRFPAKTAVELIKEGQVRYMSGFDMETKTWRKCRLCLVRTAGGYLLEFYSPQKSNRAKSGIFCFLIMETREATPLEFENLADSIFVIRAFSGVEYVIQARNPEDCQQWLKVIRESIPGVELEPAAASPRLTRQPSAPPLAANIAHSRRFFSTRSLNNVHAMTSSLYGEARIPVTIHASPPGLDVYPWFHARLSRAVSTRLVLHNGVDGHGLFLVRQSETRPGDFVLTFNCQGKAKHVRVIVMPDGECRIHQMVFETMIDLLEYFRENPMPLENSSRPPMFLREYVICWRRCSLSRTDVDVCNFLTFAGSLRLDMRAIERIVADEQAEIAQRTAALHRTHSNSYHFF